MTYSLEEKEKLGTVRYDLESQLCSAPAADSKFPCLKFGTMVMVYWYPKVVTKTKLDDR